MSLLGNLANKEIYDFLRTTTIKNSYFADQSRKLQLRSGNVSERVPEYELPYYKHVAGEYILKTPVVVQVKHPKTGAYMTQIYGNTTKIYDANKEPTVDTVNDMVYTDSAFDEMMYVTSLDTQDETMIPFTLENLHPEYADDPTSVHSKTLEAYKIPGRYYDLLCQQYPNQVDLIKAIIYPVKSAREITATEKMDNEENGATLPSLSRRRREYLVAAENFQVLNYDDSLLNENEAFNITTELKAMVKLIATRWNIKEYCFEENYPQVLWAMMWSLLPVTLIVQRYANIKTAFAHSSHIWDYLNSKGLESYKGYLNLEQTLFLYKNIQYILDNRGKQHITNLLIDELLNDVGLNIKAKTIVLETSKTLDDSRFRVPDVVSKQCKDCCKNGYCHRGITEYACPDYYCLKDLYKSTPVSLTEEFAGANKIKIIERLQTQYGYTLADATAKYTRSLLWRDAEVDSIRKTLDRDQLVDLKGDTESLDDLIKREYTSGLEPVYNEGVVEEQTHELRHINGMAAPTKLLEITKNAYNAKFGNLFNKFFTETLLHLAPRSLADGSRVIKVMNTYSFTITDQAGNYLMTFGELLASVYLGVLRSELIELFFDHINKDEVYRSGITYYRCGYPGDPTEAEQMLVAGVLLKKLKVGTEAEVAAGLADYYVGMEVALNDIYRWAPKLTREEYLAKVAGHDPITQFILWDEEKQTYVPNPSYDIAIPGNVHLTTTFKFGKPVKQETLVKAWLSDKGDHIDMLPLFKDKADKVLLIGDIYYGVTEVQEGETVEDPEIWENIPVTLKIIGAVKNNYVYDNNGEIPIIPKYFRWYSKHLTSDTGSISGRREVKYIEDIPFDTDTEIPEEPPTVKTGYMYYDASKAESYQLMQTDQYIDVDSIVDLSMDLLDNVSNQETIGKYLTTQFSLLEKIHVYAEASGSILTNLAANAVLNYCLKKGSYAVDLTGTDRRTSWPQDGKTTYTFEEERPLVATYDDWFKTNKELMNSFKGMDKADEPLEAWSVFVSTCVDLLTTGCTLPYVESTLNSRATEKLKELVTHLSSYKIAFISIANTDRESLSTTQITKDGSAKKIEEVVHPYLDPVSLDLCTPHAGGYSNDVYGDLYVYTPDTVVLEGKTYYVQTVETKHGEPIAGDVINLDIDLDEDTFTYSVIEPEVGEVIKPHTLFEKINLYDLLGVKDKTLKLMISRAGGRWYYQTGMVTDELFEVPGSEADPEVIVTTDTFLPMSYIDKTAKEKLVCKKYRKYVAGFTYIWSNYMDASVLAKYLDDSLSTTQISTSNTISDLIIDITYPDGEEPTPDFVEKGMTDE